MPTVTVLKRMFQAQIAPGNDPEFLRLLTEADLRLLEGCRFRWCRARTTLTPLDGIITLPVDFVSILMAQVDGYPVDIKDEPYEFTVDGVGDVEVGTSGTIRLIDQGINDAGQRSYKVAGLLQDGTTVYCICQYAPVALYDPDLIEGEAPEDASDTTRCPDTSALKLIMQGIIKEEASDILTSSHYFNAALRSLSSKEKSQRGGSKPQLNVRPNGPGIRRIRSFR